MRNLVHNIRSVGGFSTLFKRRRLWLHIAVRGSVSVLLQFYPKGQTLLAGMHRNSKYRCCATTWGKNNIVVNTKNGKDPRWKQIQHVWVENAHHHSCNKMKKSLKHQDVMKKREGKKWDISTLYCDTYLTWLPTVLRKEGREMPKHWIKEKHAHIRRFGDWLCKVPIKINKLSNNRLNYSHKSVRK